MIHKVRNVLYIVHGFVHATLIWTYESIPCVREVCDKRREGDIPLLRWSSTNKHGLVIDDIIDSDEKKTEDHKVQVKYFCQKPIKEIKTIWLGDVADLRIDNIIRNILNDILDESFWNILPAHVKKCMKRKGGEHSEYVKES